MRTFLFFNAQKVIARVFFVFTVFVLGVCLTQTAIAATEETTSAKQPGQTIYTERQLQDLISPSVVRIIQHVEGSAQIPSFVIDIEERTISLDETKNPALFDNISENIIGTGFIVSPDGHIITNAHLVSDLTSKLAIITPYVKEAVQEAEDVTGKSIEDDTVFSLDILDFFIQNSTFKFSKKIIVIDPQTQMQINEETANESVITKISEIGLSANILYVNDNFYKGDDNLAVIKIKGKDLPAIFISDENISRKDDNFYAFNTSGIYNFKNINDLKSGRVYDLELKASSVVMDKIDIAVLHTNLKLNSSASGGPSFNANGEITGILALEGEEGGFTDTPVQMLIIPNNIIRATLDKVGIASGDGVYVTHIKKGFEYINNESCDEASNEFNIAVSSQSPFVKSVPLNSYLVECYEASKAEKPQTKYISGILNMIQGKSVSLDLLDWVIIVLLVLLGLTLLMIFVVTVGRIRNKKKDSYKPFKDNRTEEMQKARRAPLSETLPKQARETPFRSVGRDVVVLSSDKFSSHLRSQNNNDISNKISASSSSLESLRTIPKEDQERLAELWPNKYNNNKTDSSIIGEKISEEKMIETTSSVNPKLIKYIQETYALGFDDKEIEQELTRAGWKREDIISAFDLLESTKKLKINNKKNKKNNL